MLKASYARVFSLPQEASTHEPRRISHATGPHMMNQCWAWMSKYHIQKWNSICWACEHDPLLSWWISKEIKLIDKRLANLNAVKLPPSGGRICGVIRRVLQPLHLSSNAKVAAHVWGNSVFLLSMCGPLIKIWAYMWQRFAGRAQQLHVALSLTPRVLIMDD